MDVCEVLAHGSTNHIGTGHVRATARGLSAEGLGVLAYDAPGHGHSGGHSTVAPLPLPLPLVHGDADHYFPRKHPYGLAAAAGDGAELWIEPGMGHAQKAATPDLIALRARQIRCLVPA